MPTPAGFPMATPIACATAEGGIDATENRDRLLRVARLALESEPPPTLAAVDRAAGVGQATLYRNFPTWHNLVMAVHRADVAELIDMVPTLLAEQTPGEALRLWLGRFAEHGRIKKGLGEAIHAARQDQLASEGYAPVVAALEAILAAGIAVGTFRQQVTGEELLLLVGFLWRLDLTQDRDERSVRMLDVIVSGLTVMDDRAQRPARCTSEVSWTMSWRSRISATAAGSGRPPLSRSRAASSSK